MTCRELIAFLLAYLADELPARERRRFERHLRPCRSCAAYLASYRATIRLGRQACADDRLPDDLPEELVRAITAARRTDRLERDG